MLGRDQLVFFLDICLLLQYILFIEHFLKLSDAIQKYQNTKKARRFIAVVVGTLYALFAYLVFFLEELSWDSEVIRGVSYNICGAQRLSNSICTPANRL